MRHRPRGRFPAPALDEIALVPSDGFDLVPASDELGPVAVSGALVLAPVLSEFVPVPAFGELVPAAGGLAPVAVAVATELVAARLADAEAVPAHSVAEPAPVPPADAEAVPAAPGGLAPAPAADAEPRPVHADGDLTLARVAVAPRLASRQP